MTNKKFICLYNRDVLIPIVLLLVSIFLFPKISLAADLRIVTDRSTYKVGETITASVFLSSVSESANAVSGILNFSSDYLQINSLSKTGSIINLWVQEPSFSNANGRVSFEGAILNPGFRGGSGRVLSINFRAKQVGTTNLSFSTGSILANDGEGTSILKNLGRTSITIQPAATPQPETKTPPKLEDKIVASSTPVIKDENPDLEVRELKTERGNRTSFIIIGEGRSAEIDHYEVTLDDSSTLILPGKNSLTYNTPNLAQDDHLIIVVAVDRLGNKTQQQLIFTIKPSLDAKNLFRWGNSFISILSIIVLLAILLAVLIMIISSTKQSLSLLRKKLQQEITEAEAGVHKAFDLIQQDLQEQVRLLNKVKTKRKLSLAETKLLKTLESDLIQAEKFIKKEIEDINRQIK